MSDENVREYAALLRMADSRTLDTLLIDRNFSSPSAELRALAARVIGQVGRARAAPRIPALRTLMRGTDTEVMAQAAYALGLLRDTAGAADLVYGLRGPPVVAREAAWALGQIGNSAGSSIVDALALWHTDPGTRVQLLLASAKLSPVPVASVVAQFNDENPSVIWAAAYAISRTRTASGLNALWALGDSVEAHLPVRADDSALLRDRQRAPYVRRESAPYRIRAEIARMLTRSVTGDTLAPQAIAGLERYALDHHPHVRINAIRSLGSFGARARSIVIASLRDPDPNARIAAAQAIGAVRDSASFDWSGPWDADTAFAYRQALLESAMRLHVELPDFAAWSAHSDWRRRATAASAAGFGRTEEHRLRLAQPLLADPDARVRAAAVSGVAPDTGSLTAVVRALLTTASRDSDPQVRERAVSRLSRRPESEDEPASPVREIAWYVDVVRTIVVPTLDGRPLQVIVATERGSIGIEFFGAAAPLTVKNFLDLAKAGTYRGTRFHRVVPNFVAQDGDPRGDGSGGPGYSIRDELNNHRYDRGVLGMALSGPDTGGSQWFITHSPQPHLDGGYTVFGRVVSGFDVLDRIVQGDLVVDIR